MDTETPVPEAPVPVKKNMKRFTIEKIIPCGTWTWSTKSDVCAICRNNISNLCIKCESDKNTKMEEDDEVDEIKCDSVVGVCEHSFHYHCITQWLNTRNVCPMDNTEWKYKTKKVPIS